MKKNNSTNKDAAFIRDYIEHEYGRQALPQSLSAGNITQFVSGRRQKKRNHGVLRRVIAGTLAACVALCGIAAYNFAAFSPAAPLSADNADYAESYGEIEQLIKKYKKTLAANSSVVNLYYSADTTGTGGDFSQTNLRTEGVDEADTLKTDGEYIYAVLNGNMLSILKSSESGKTERCALIDAAQELNIKGDVQLRGIYVYGNMLIALCDIYAYSPEKGRCGALLYDIADKTAPRLVNSFMYDGCLLSSRISQGSLILISNYYMDIYSEDRERLFPSVYCGGTGEMLPAQDIALVNPERPDMYLLISKIKLSEPEGKPQTLALLGGGVHSYCTKNTLYIVSDGSENPFVYFDRLFIEKSTVLSFDISADKPRFIAKGSFDGGIIDSFAISEYGENLRIAAGLSGGSAVYVMNRQLEIIGSVSGIAPGESIESVRFMGDFAYMVTFLQTDPLFVINLEKPEKPFVAGELKLPGFSAYLHPVGAGLMLGVGFGGDEAGLDGSAKISLFDVSVPEKPVELDSLSLENSYFDSYYKAFVSVSNGSFILPFEKIPPAQSDGGVYSSQSEYCCGSLRFAVSDKKLSLLNEYAEAAPDSGGVRALYIGGTVYNISPAGHISAFDMESGELLFSGEAGDCSDR